MISQHAFFSVSYIRTLMCSKMSIKMWSTLVCLFFIQKTERLTEDGISAPMDAVQGQRSYVEEHNDREIKGV